MKHVIPVMLRQFEAEPGRLDHQHSRRLPRRYTGIPYVTYNASKAAMNMLTKSTAVEYAARGHSR